MSSSLDESKNFATTESECSMTNILPQLLVSSSLDESKNSATTESESSTTNTQPMHAAILMLWRLVSPD